MRTADAVTLAIESLRRHRLRTALTVLAMGVGAGAVLLLTGLGDAAKAFVVDQFSSVGTHIVLVHPGKTETSGFGSMGGGATRDLTIADAEALRRQVRGVHDAAPISIGAAPFESGGLSRDVYVIGTTAAYQRIRDVHVALGRFLPPGDPRRGERVVVIGSKLAHEIFGNANPLGEVVRIGQARFRVIGVLEPKGMSLGVEFDELAMVPVATGLQLFNQSSLARVMLQAHDAASVPALIEEARAILKDRHRDEDFSIVTQDAMLKSFQSIIDALTIALAGIAAISIAVAGIGIMNVMLVSVSERTGEVGLLKAMGARPRQITGLFLVEALVLSGLGAAAGITVGVSLMLAAGHAWALLPIRPSPGWIAVIALMSLVAGAAFGLMPARRAARLPAVEALRSAR